MPFSTIGVVAMMMSQEDIPAFLLDALTKHLIKVTEAKTDAIKAQMVLQDALAIQEHLSNALVTISDALTDAMTTQVALSYAQTPGIRLSYAQTPGIRLSYALDAQMKLVEAQRKLVVLENSRVQTTSQALVEFQSIVMKTLSKMN
jgi:hypothetical protein